MASPKHSTFRTGEITHTTKSTLPTIVILLSNLGSDICRKTTGFGKKVPSFAFRIFDEDVLSGKRFFMNHLYVISKWQSLAKILVRKYARQTNQNIARLLMKSEQQKKHYVTNLTSRLPN